MTAIHAVLKEDMRNDPTVETVGYEFMEGLRMLQAEFSCLQWVIGENPDFDELIDQVRRRAASIARSN